MGYRSTMDVDTSSAVILHLEKLQAEIEKLEYLNDIVFDQFGRVAGIEDREACNNYDDEKLAELVSKYLKAGSIDITYAGEDGKNWGWRVTPHHIQELKMILVSEGEPREVK